MSVKWHGHVTKPQKINGGGPQGATFGILEYLSQSNNNADFVSESSDMYYWMVGEKKFSPLGGSC